MIAYRCYLIGEDGHIKNSQVIECPSDAAALAEAERGLAASEYPAVEVWDKARRVGRVGHARDQVEMSGKKPRSSMDPLGPEADPKPGLLAPRAG
jgi:hypothetical protein